MRIEIGIYNTYKNGKYYNLGTLEEATKLVKDNIFFVEYGIQASKTINTNNIIGAIYHIKVIEIEQDDNNIPYPKIKLVGRFKIFNDKFKSLLDDGECKFWMRSWANTDVQTPNSKILRIIGFDYDINTKKEKNK